jgi:hypothetical protein
MVRVFGGAVMVVAGIAAFIEAHSHAPTARLECPNGRGVRTDCTEDQWVFVPHGMSHTVYDLLRIGGWALVIIGALLVIVGLIAYARSAAPAR